MEGFGDGGFVNVLRGFHDGGHDGGEIASDARSVEHDLNDLRIEHAVERDAVGGGFVTGDLADGFGEGLAVVGAGAADEGAVDVEENE